MDTTTDNNDDIREVLESSFDSSDNESFNSVEDGATSTSHSEGLEHSPENSDLNLPDEPRREYSRDEKGKFAPKNAETDKNASKMPEEGIKPAAKAGQPPVQGERPAKDPLARAPEAWKPEAREHWKDIPDGAKAEIIRHNQLVYDTLQRTSEERKFAHAVRNTIAPFEHLIKAEGGNPVQAIDNLLSTAALLRTGTADQIANLVTQITNQYGIGRFGNQFIERLDSALAGQAPRPENPEIAAMRQQYEKEMAPLRQMQQQIQQQQQMAQYQQQMQAHQEIEQFQQNAEFLNDVRMEMADIIDMGAQRGVNYTLQQAYDIACRAHPEISRVMAQREQAKAAQSLNNNAKRARAAAVSVGGSPALGGDDSGTADSVRDALEFAISRSTR